MMKNIIFLLVIVSIALTSSGCLLMMGGTKKPIVFVDAPENTVYKLNGEVLKLEDVTAFSEYQGNNTTIKYKYPGVKIKMTKKPVIKIESGDQKGSAKIKTRPAIGMLVFEALITWGIGTVVDLATGAYMYTNHRLIDVPAVLNGNAPRSQKELKKKLMTEFKNK